MKRQTTFVAGLLAAFMTTNAFALDLNVKYNVDDHKLKLTGTAYAPVSVIVGASDASELTPESLAMTAAAVQYDWRGETSIDEELAIDPNLPSGTYILRARSNEQVIVASSSADRLYGSVADNKQLIEKSFYHINSSDASLLLDKINRVSGDASAMYDFISRGTVGSYSTSCIELLELDSVDFSICGPYICTQMVGTKNGSDYSDLEEIKQLLNEYSLLYKISHSSSTSSAITLLKNNSSIFGQSNIDTYVSTLSAAAQQKLFELMKTFLASGKSFSQRIPELSALATVQAADRWQILKTVITDTHKTVLNIDYNVDNADSVFQKMMSYTYTSFDDISAGFEKAKTKVSNTDKDSPSKDSSGGGSFQIAPSALEQRGETSNASVFRDVSADFWAFDAINRLSGLGVISGYPDGTFAPNSCVTRAEFVKMFCSAFAISDVGRSVNFSDVSTDDWYYDYICRAYGAGLINGVSDFKFNPNGTISREDASTIVYRYLSGKGLLSQDVIEFSDSHEFSQYSRAAIASLAGNNIVNGVGDGIFDAKENITRAACAMLICNCLDV